MDQSMASEKDAVRIVRGTALEGQFTGPGGTGRADVSDFTGAGSAETWVGLVKLPPLTVTGPHNHGEQELTIYVVAGQGRICWGDGLAYAGDIGPGDFVYFSAFAPHQEENLSAETTLDLVVVRSDRERVFNPLEMTVVETPEMVG
jgi:uncharacterized RmlC-like cupin family protein